MPLSKLIPRTGIQRVYYKSIIIIVIIINLLDFWIDHLIALQII